MLPDYELLELVLFRVFARKDTKDVAERLIARFGSFAEVINAPAEELKQVKDVGNAVVTELKIIQASALRLAKSEIAGRPVLSSWTQVLDYVRAARAYENCELFRILFVDKKNLLIADEVQGEGAVDHARLFVRELVKRGLELSATGISLVHNHRSGNLSPWLADNDMTKLMMEAARRFGSRSHYCRALGTG